MNPVIWQIKYQLDGSKKWFWATLLLSIATIWITYDNFTLNQQVAEIETKITLEKEAKAAHSRSSSESGMTVLSFPSILELSDQQALIHEVAKNNKIYIEEIRYTLSKIPETKLATYKMEFEFNKDYPSMRKFISDLLIALPNASVDKIQFSRESYKTDVIATQITLTLFYKQP